MKKTIGFILAGTFFVYAAIYMDVRLRARAAYLEGEKYATWARDPAQKTAYLEKIYQEEKNKLPQDADYQARLEALEFEKNFQLNESSLKYAYQWYKDAYELFSPPESRWTKAARLKAPETLALWKEELRAKNIPFDDYMFE